MNELLAHHLNLSPPRARRVLLNSLDDRLQGLLLEGKRVVLMTARRVPERVGFALVVLTLNPDDGTLGLWEAILQSFDRYPSLTLKTPQLHWFERSIHDFFGIMPEGHPRFKSLILHEAWPEGFHPLREPQPTMKADAPPRSEYRFLTVQGEGGFEVPVGPIHAGIIE